MHTCITYVSEERSYLYRIYTNRCAHKAVTINYIETIIRIDLYDHVRFMQSEQVELEFDPNRDMLIESKLLKKKDSHNGENTQIII